MKSIDTHTRVKKKTDIISSKIDGEAVMMSLKNGEYYGLNETGSYIWDELTHETSIRNLVNGLLEQYDIDEENCLQEVIQLVKELHHKDLIEIVEP